MRKLSRTKNERRRLLQGLVRELVLHGKIKTTLAKAKTVRPVVEKLVTLAKKGSVTEVKKLIAKRDVEKKLFADVKAKLTERNSGYTRITKLGKRIGDATEVTLLQFIYDQPNKTSKR